MDNRLISLNAAIDALDKVAEMFPYRIPGNAKTYRQYNEAWSDAIDAAENALEALPSAQPVVISKSENTTECEDAVSRAAALDALNGLTEIFLNNLPPTIDRADAVDAIKALPSAQPEWNNHTVACLLAELFDDTCACNYNGIDEWLPGKCEVIDACPKPAGVACWEKFLKYRAERRTDD